jgi:hypothetical protein
MTEHPDLLNAVFAMGWIFGVLLPLLGAYLSTFDRLLTVKRSDEMQQ